MNSSPFSHVGFAVRSEIGLKRKNNEDSHGEFPKSGVWCVADGMGGGDDGEIASAAVIREIGLFCASRPMDGEKAYAGADMAEGVRRAVNKASQWIFRRAVEKSLKGCGSTFVGVVLDAAQPGRALALHAGDSRLYRLRGREIRQITKDHSAAELIGAKNEAELNPMFRGMILRAVGVRPAVEIETTPFDLQEGDTVLICSDGLSKMVADRRVSALVRKSGEDVEDAVANLIRATYDAGAVDNVTVQLLRIGRLPQPCPTVVEPACEDGHEASDADGEDAPTGETFVGPTTHETGCEPIGESADGQTEVSEVFRAAEDTSDPKPVGIERTAFLRRFRLPLTVVGILAFAVLLWWYGSSVWRVSSGRPSAVTSMSGLVVPTGTADRVQAAERPAARPEGKPQGASAPDVPTAGESAAPGLGQASDDRERAMVLERLKATRRHVRQDEIRLQCEDVALTDALGNLIRSCRGTAFDELVARVDVVCGQRHGARLRLLGRRLAAMKPDDESAGSAASDLIAGLQKAAASQRPGAGTIGELAGISDLDTTSAKAFSTCAAAIVAASANAKKAVR